MYDGDTIEFGRIECRRKCELKVELPFIGSSNEQGLEALNKGRNFLEPKG
jgi:hypothetical protein